MKQIVFDTADLPADRRFADFAALTDDFLIEPMGDPAKFRARSVVTVVGPIMINHVRMSAMRCTRDPYRLFPDLRDHYSFSLLLAGKVCGRIEGVHFAYEAGGGLFLDLMRSMQVTTPVETDAYFMLFPRYFIDEALPGMAPHGPLAPSPALSLIGDFVATLLRQAPSLSDTMGGPYAKALRELTIAAIAPLSQPLTVGERRSAHLLDRVIALIDAGLAQPPAIDKLQHELGVSRSALYAAVAAVGGVNELIRRRRLIAVHRQLKDPRETRSIAALALASGFHDPQSFSRQFRRAYAMTPGQVRARGRASLPYVRQMEGDVIENYHAIVGEIAADRGEFEMTSTQGNVIQGR